MTLIRALRAEVIKLRRTLALTLIFVAPLAVVLLSVLNFLRASTFFFGEELDAWEWLIRNTIGLWALLLLPLLIALETALIGGLEHQNGGWKHLFVLAIPRWVSYIAKQLMVLLMIGVSCLILMLGILAAGILVQLLNLRPEVTFSEIPWQKFIIATSLVYLAAWLLITIHTWVGLRFRQFTVAMGVAIIFVLAGFMIANVDLGIYFPWSMPILSVAAVFDHQGSGIDTLLLLNIFGMILITPLACLDLIRRDIK
jgi:ABC-2 type transport system permease protein